MTTVRHRKIKTFYIDGQFIDDSVMAQVKEINERVLNVQMRDRGYVPVLDMNPVWAVEYDPRANEWKFAMSMYGFYIGKRKSWQYEGSSQGKLIPRSTPPTTLKQ